MFFFVSRLSVKPHNEILVSLWSWQALSIKLGGAVPEWLQQRYKSKWKHQKQTKEEKEEKLEAQKKEREDKKRKEFEDAKAELLEVIHIIIFFRRSNIFYSEGPS